MSNKRTELNLSIDARNKSLHKAFMCTAAVAMSVAVINFPVRMGQMHDLGVWSDIVKNSDLLRYISNHVKGAGQAATQSQLLGIAAAEFWASKKESNSLKKYGSPLIEIRQDFTYVAASACLIGAFCWEKISQASHPHNLFDTKDMVWYGIGVGALLSINAAVKAVNKHFYPETPQKYQEVKKLLELPTPSIQNLNSSAKPNQALPSLP